jgi:serine/threonine-protein kinase
MEPGALLGGKYRLLRLIGEGGMGAVWAATNELTHRNFALKLIAGEKVPSKEARERLLREARVCGGLKHRNVVDLYDVGLTEEGSPFLVMELLRGESLAQSLERGGRLRPETAAGITMAIARGLRAAHRAGIVHRDLKPANVFLHEEPEVGTVVKILDFGVSRVISGDEIRRTSPGVAIGSPAYMSPEQATGAEALDHRADLWALGVVLFEMLSGVLPFEGPTEYSVMTEIVHGRIPSVAEFVTGVDPRLVSIVERCLQRSVSDRVESADEIIAALEVIIRRGDAAAAAPPAGFVSAPVRGTSTRRGLAAPASEPPASAPTVEYPALPAEDLVSVPATSQLPVAKVGSGSVPVVMHLPAVAAPPSSGQGGRGRWRQAVGAVALAAAAVGIAFLAMARSPRGVVADAPAPEPAQAAAPATAVAAPGFVPSSVPDASDSVAGPTGAPSSVASSSPRASPGMVPAGGKVAKPPAAADAGPARARPTTFDDPG